MKKGGLLLALGLPKKDEGDGNEKSIDQDAKESAIQDFFEAGKKEDWAGAAEAFKRAYELCSGDEGDEGDEGE